MDFEGIGTRLRHLRIKAGMTQPELARGVTSVSHVSLIESGKRQPSHEIVEKLAERLGVTAAVLREGANAISNQERRKDFLFAEMAHKNGDSEFAERTLRKLISESTLIESAEFMYRLRNLHAKTLEGLGRIEEAAEEIKLAMIDADNAGLPLEKLEMTIDLSRYAREAGDFVTALELISDAQKNVPYQLQQSATYARMLSSAIAIHILRGDYIRAQKLSTEALDIFDEETDPRAIASIMWNASLAADGQQDTTTALIMAQRAANLFQQIDDSRAEGRLRFTISWLFTRQTPPNVEAAREQLVRSEELLAEAGTELDKAKWETEMARVEWLEGRYEAALETATNSLVRLGEDGERLQRADAYLLVARSQISLGRTAESVMNLEAARSSLSGMEPSLMNASAWRELGDIYAMLNYLPEAISAYREALHDAGVPASPIAFTEAQRAESEILFGDSSNNFSSND